jgi:hypothetical protein
MLFSSLLAILSASFFFLKVSNLSTVALIFLVPSLFLIIFLSLVFYDLKPSVARI